MSSSNQTKFRKNFNWLTLTIATIATLAGVSVQLWESIFKKTFTNFTVNPNYAISLSQTDSLQVLVSKLQDKLDKLSLQRGLDTSVGFNELAESLKPLKNFEYRLTRLEEQTKGLRQALNHNDPENIITIARLGDAIKSIEEKSDFINKANESQYNSFKDAVLREMEAANKSNYWIFAAVIPLILNLGYNVWKDARDKKTA